MGMNTRIEPATNTHGLRFHVDPLVALQLLTPWRVHSLQSCGVELTFPCLYLLIYRLFLSRQPTIILIASKRPVLSRSDSMEPLSKTRRAFESFPSEVVWTILKQLQPSNTFLSTYDARGPEPQRNLDMLESYRGLAAACRTSKWLSAIARPLLYEQVVISDTRGLANLFRTMVKKPGVRTEVRGFAMLRPLSENVDVQDRPLTPIELGLPFLDANEPLLWDEGDAIDLDTHQPFRHRSRRPSCLGFINIGPDTVAWVEDFYATSYWPSTLEEKEVAAACGICADELFTAPNILVAALASMPRLKHLYLFLSKPVAGISWYPIETLAIKNIFNFLLSPPGRATPARGGRRFLQELSTIILEPAHSEEIESLDVFRTLSLVLAGCSTLRRIELKGNVMLGERFVEDLGSNQDPENMRYLQAPLGENVIELTIVQTSSIHTTMSYVPTFFPNLRSLVVECVDSTLGWVDSTDSDDSEEKFQRQLVRLHKTLTTLKITGIPNRTCSWDNVREYTSLLAPEIEQMEGLKHLTADCAWLFGSRDLSTSHGIISRLPKGLVTFHLVDYWGVSIDGPTGPELAASEIPEAELKALEYYPELLSPDGERYEAPTYFFQDLLGVLAEESQTRFQNLQHVTLSSPCFPVAAGFTKPAVTEELISKLSMLFRSNNIAFSFHAIAGETNIFPHEWGRLA